MLKKYMEEAIKEARKSYELNEVPIGAVIVKDEKIIARAHNMRNSEKNPLAHAEIIAISKAAKVIGDWRFDDCTMFVTVEPCPMCSGAILQARIPKLVYATENLKAGAAGSIINILQNEKFNHEVEIESGILKEEASNLMKSFFKDLRENRLT